MSRRRNYLTRSFCTGVRLACSPISAAPSSPRRDPSTAKRRRLLAASALPLMAAAVLYVMAPRAGDAPQVLDLTAVGRTVRTARAGQRPAQRRGHRAAQRHARPHLPSLGIDSATLAELRALPDVRKAFDILRPGDIITRHAHRRRAAVAQPQHQRHAHALGVACRRRLRGQLHREPARDRDRRRECAHRQLAVRGGPATPACRPRR